MRHARALCPRRSERLPSGSYHSRVEAVNVVDVGALAKELLEKLVEAHPRRQRVLSDLTVSTGSAELFHQMSFLRDRCRWCAQHDSNVRPPGSQLSILR